MTLLLEKLEPWFGQTHLTEAQLLSVVHHSTKPSVIDDPVAVSEPDSLDVIEIPRSCNIIFRLKFTLSGILEILLPAQQKEWQKES